MQMMTIELNSEQQKAAQATEGAVMVLAGAGSGKTRVLTARIANLIKNGVYPFNILAITFTNKAANEMKERLESIVDCSGMTVCTIHSMCCRILRAEANLLGFKSGFSIYTEVDTKRLLKRLCAGEQADKLAEHAHYYLGLAKNSGASVSEFIDEANVVAEEHGESVAKIMKEYQRSLKESNAMDFDDLLYFTYVLFRDFPDVLQKYKEKYKYISIDEFQDTNAVQYQIFKLLAGADGNIFVVGDDDQSIYGWRGADADNMQRFRKDFKDVKVFYLEQNYRSTKKILTVANAIISKNDGRFDKTLWTQNDDGVRVESYSAYNESDEARFVVQTIQALTERGYEYRDFAVLMRINALSRGFEQELISYGIPFKVFGGFKFFERKEIKDATAYLRLIVNPFDNEAFLRVINTPKRGIGDGTLAKIREFALSLHTNFLFALSEIDKAENINLATRIKLSAFFEMMKELAVMARTATVDKIVSAVIVRSGLNIGGATEEEQSRVENLGEFVSAAAEFTLANPDAKLNDFLESISLKSDLDEMDEQNYVSVATIHAAKGLEWRTVFVVGNDDGIFPSSRSILDMAQLKEERRLMYVAATRARERLFVTRAQSRFMYGDRKYMTAGRFFKEIAGEPDKTQKYDKDGVPMYDISIDDRFSAEKAKSDDRVKIAIESLQIGQKVMHKVYGEGIVLTIKGENADVAFKSVGKKTLSLKYAPLSLLK